MALSGDLGSGKTTFVQGLARGLGIQQPVVSPTFVLMRQYDSKSKNLYHVDLYRITTKPEREYTALGIGEVVGRAENIVVIEWAEKVKNLLPKNTIWITFETIDESRRRIQTNNETLY